MLDAQEVCELDEVKWRSLSLAVMQRLKRLLTGVSDPEGVKQENAARDERKALAAKHKAEAHRQRKLERQRSATLCFLQRFSWLPRQCCFVQHTLFLALAGTPVTHSSCRHLVM